MTKKHTPLSEATDAQIEDFASQAVASYRKHCKDPIAAAESDLLGQALELIQEMQEELVIHCDAVHKVVAWEKARALLAQRKEQ